MKSGLLLLGLLTLWADLPPATGQLRQVKTGKCPAPINAGAANCNNFCSTDADCPGSERCCSNSCGRECRLPIGAKAGTCPKRRVLQTFAPCDNKCTDDRDCPNRKKCCFTGCGLGCLAPVTDLRPFPGDICRLPPETGPCEALIPRFFYNPASRTCKSFIYSGCQGNGNNFRTLLECQRACWKRGPTRERDWEEPRA
ncbi:uncharacterized protein LOC116814632 isoform X3 [Chelonoidis abingdonii]|uniref:uncharacterized protein LOC116814632 isoform X3 n=1 Tax=Chelonoidis abingdonii TaxID=106734 RepID=UPI003F49ADEE